MNLFGLNKAKKAPSTDPDDKIKRAARAMVAIETFFDENFRRKGIDIGFGLTGRILGGLANFAVNDADTSVLLPILLCIDKKMGFKPVGVVGSQETVQQLEQELQQVHGARAATVARRRCLSVRIEGTDFPFYFMKAKEDAAIDELAGQAIVVTDVGLAAQSWLESDAARLTQVRVRYQKSVAGDVFVSELNRLLAG